MLREGSLEYLVVRYPHMRDMRGSDGDAFRIIPVHSASHRRNLTLLMIERCSYIVLRVPYVTGHYIASGMMGATMEDS